jgi:hypothetical protein
MKSGSAGQAILAYYIFYKRVRCNFSYCIILDDHSFLIIDTNLLLKSNPTTDVTLHRTRNYFTFYFFQCSPSRKIFYIQVVFILFIYLFLLI